MDTQYHNNLVDHNIGRMVDKFNQQYSTGIVIDNIPPDETGHFDSVDNGDAHAIDMANLGM